MPVIFPKVFLDFTVFAQFNMSSGDVGPGTARQIRYSKADYLAMVTKYFLGFRQDYPVPWSGPNSIDYTLFYDGDSVDTVTSGPGTFGPPLDLSFVGHASLEHDSSVDDFPECPFLDGVGPPREPANISKTATVAPQVTFSLLNPYCLQSGWDTATEFWLQFDLTISPGLSNTHFVCEPSETQGDDGGTLPTNYLGIDYAGGSAFPDATSSIPLGDGTTAAFFLDPGVADKVIVNDFQSNN